MTPRIKFGVITFDCYCNLKKQMLARHKAMLEQKSYMNEQLKAILKRNRVLEVQMITFACSSALTINHLSQNVFVSRFVGGDRACSEIQQESAKHIVH